MQFVLTEWKVERKRFHFLEVALKSVEVLCSFAFSVVCNCSGKRISEVLCVLPTLMETSLAFRPLKQDAIQWEDSSVVTIGPWSSSSFLLRENEKGWLLEDKYEIELPCLSWSRVFGAAGLVATGCLLRCSLNCPRISQLLVIVYSSLD